MQPLPVYDNHIHMSPHGRNVEALKEYKAAGGTALTLVTLPYPEAIIAEGSDFARSYQITYNLAEKARKETGLEINVAVGPYPVLLIPLSEKYGLKKAESILTEGMDLAGNAIEEGKAVAIGEIGRPHFECDPEVLEASNRILQRGMEIAKENDVPVIIHCESGTTETNRSLSEIARRAGLDPGLVIKHSSPPFVTEKETFGVFPSIPASKSNIKDAILKGSDRFMLETDYIDEPSRPTAIMSVTTVPHKIKWMSDSELADEDFIHHICKDIPDHFYKRRIHSETVSLYSYGGIYANMDEAKITCIYDEGALEGTSFIGARGFSVLIEADGEMTLFGLGRRSRYLNNNLFEAGVDPLALSRAVVSHGHIDHWGGLPAVLRSRETPLDIFAPLSAWGKKRIGGYTGMVVSDDYSERYVRRDVGGWVQLSEHLFITPPQQFHKSQEDEIFMVLVSKNGPVLISGCCHCGLDHIFETVRDKFGGYPVAVLGGLHIGEKKDKLADIYADYLKTMGCRHLYLNHCTGVYGIGRLRVTLGLNGVNDFYVGQSVTYRVI